MMTKQRNFCAAVQRLAEAVAEYRDNPSSTVRDGVIQRFEFTFELAWKSLKEYMEDQGALGLQFPKQVLKEAYAAGLLDDDRVWLDMLSSRNVTSHIYDDAQAAAVMSDIQQHYLQTLLALASFYAPEEGAAPTPRRG